MGMDILQITNYVRGLFARLAQGGWRPVFGWGGVPFFYSLLKFSYIDAVANQLPLPEGYYLAVNTLFGLYLGAFIARGVEKVVERHQTSPTGGLVNNEAIA